MKSIMQVNKNQCYRCKRYIQTEEHHIFGGVANRPKSEKYGLKVYLCHDCHNRDKKHKSIHFDKEEMLKLHQEGQLIYMKYYNKTIDDFRKEFKINYL